MVMAYWGEALCYRHPLWTDDIPAWTSAIKAFDRGLTISNGSSIRNLSDDEMYLFEAVKLYVTTSSVNSSESASFFAEALNSKLDRFTHNIDIQAFAAMSLMAQREELLVDATDQEAPFYKTLLDKARTLLTTQLDVPNNFHPGVLHLMVHAFDFPLNPMPLSAIRAANLLQTRATRL